ncbi:MAG: FAD-binding oxidoreductase [Algicola sp.]|nr:FAD-binding oxidoreductase [Algicola sp.]
MSLTGWGNYPKSQNTAVKYDKQDDLKALIAQHNDVIPHGNGRSYGDSAIGKTIIKVKPHDLFLDFDSDKGILRVEAGVLLADIIKAMVPRGWFLKIVPGTKLITVGGAIASDVHGKNHHVAGCFSESVETFKLMLPDGSVVDCSKTENNELFQATCGGMGLTGVIVEATLSLKKINSKTIQQTTIKNQNLKETFAAFEQYRDVPYSVAWIDCLAKGDNIGRSLLMVGDFCDDGKLKYESPAKPAIPFNFPVFALNPLSVKAFNWLYYAKVTKAVSKQKVSIDTFFFPLDAIGHWNRIYGRNGFTQYQFILPKESSFEGLETILQAISDSNKGSFLAVLKLYGPANDNYLSFPLEGYSLALDFKIEKGLFALLDQLDQIVVEHGGRIYLAKDARVSKTVFEAGYPHIEKFRALRSQYQMDQKFNSFQSKRLEI